MILATVSPDLNCSISFAVNPRAYNKNLTVAFSTQTTMTRSQSTLRVCMWQLVGYLYANSRMLQHHCEGVVVSAVLASKQSSGNSTQVTRIEFLHKFTGYTTKK